MAGEGAPALTVWRCAVCQKVLGEYAGDGFTFRIKCPHRRREGQGRCEAWNTLTVPRAGRPIPVSRTPVLQ